MSDTIASTNREAKEKEDSPVIGYMCLVDWQWELGAALGGNTIYPSEDDCRESRKCIAKCGMVEVEVKFRRIVSPPQL